MSDAPAHPPPVPAVDDPSIRCLGTTTTPAAHVSIDNGQSAFGNPELPIPPRYWWLKRITLAVGILFILLIALRLWWGWIADRRLDALIAEYRTRGEPVDPEDFDTDPVPDDPNTFFFFQTSNLVIPLAEEINTLFYDLQNPNDLRERLDDVRRLVEVDSRVLAHLRKARSAPPADWPVRLREPLYKCDWLPPLFEYRALSKLLWLDASLRFVQHDHSGAVESLRDLLAEADVVATHPSLLCQLVANAIAILGITRIEQMTPTLSVSTLSGSADLRVSSATREQAEALIQQLLDENVAWRGFSRALFFERTFLLDSHKFWTQGARQSVSAGIGMWGRSVPTWAYLPDPLFRPLRTLDLAVSLRALTIAAYGARLYDGRGTLQALESGDTDKVSGLKKHWTHGFSNETLSSVRRFAILYMRAIALRRMAAVPLAMRLFELDHGRMPQSLSELLPKYLSKLPADPFAPDARILSYKPFAVPPVLYSINTNGTDEGGALGRDHRHRFASTDGDLLFYLDGIDPQSLEDSQPTEPESSETGDNEDNVGDEDGEPEVDDHSGDEP